MQEQQRIPAFQKLNCVACEANMDPLILLLPRWSLWLYWRCVYISKCEEGSTQMIGRMSKTTHIKQYSEVLSM